MERNPRWALIIGGLILLNLAASAQAAEVVVGDFSHGDLSPWREKSFLGHSQYALTDNDGHQVLKADSRAQASGLFREISIDLKRTPYLNWSWKIDHTLKGNNEKSKGGDDYPARIYVVVSGGLLFWRTLALNYVWSSHEPVGSHWPNAYTDHAQMVAVRSGDEEIGQWRDEKHNVREDLRRLFGKEIDQIDAVAIMTDTDNTGQQATAYYGDIYFSAE